MRLLARLLDDAFKIPGTKFRVGWDGIIGLALGVAGGILVAWVCGFIFTTLFGCRNVNLD